MRKPISAARPRVFVIGRPWISNPPPPTTIEEDLAEFFDISARASLPAEDALARKISIRRDWVVAKASLKGPAKKKDGKEKSDASDSEDEAEPSVRRGLLGEFPRRHRFATPMYQQPSDKVTNVYNPSVITGFFVRKS